MIEGAGGSKYFVTIEGMEHGFPRGGRAGSLWLDARSSRRACRANGTDRTAFNSIDNIPGAPTTA